jgi:hypothetical protein
MTSYDVKSGDQSVLAQKINSSTTTGIRIAAMNINGASLAWANQAGVFEISELSDTTLKREWVSYTGGTTDDDDVFTPTGVVRGVARDTTDTTVGGTGVAFSKGADVRFVTFHDLLNKKANVDRADEINATWTVGTGGEIIFSGTDKAGLRVKSMTTSERDALVSAPDGSIIFNSTTGVLNVREGGAWVAYGTGGSVANASTTVAGKVEQATSAQIGTATELGETGAPLFINPTSTVKTSTGAPDANKLGVLGANGKFDAGFLPAGFLFGDGSDGDVTLVSDGTLTRDMFYNDLNLSTFTLNTAGFRVFVKGTLSGSGKIKAPTGNAGSAGGAASGGTAGAAGAAGTASGSGTLPQNTAGVAGTIGATGVSSNTAGNAGGNGTAGGALTNSIAATAGSAGGNAGAGGKGDPGGANVGGTGGSGGTAGTAAAAARQPISFYEIFATFAGGTWTPLSGVGKSGGGGGGGSGGRNGSSGSSGGGGGGGGSGATGGFFYIAANTLTGTWNIESIGGAGGAGGIGGNSTADASTGGGGGGGGGSGGPGGSGILLKSTSSGWTGTFVLTGGAAGAGASGGTPSTNGASGVSGTAGSIGATGASITITI